MNAPATLTRRAVLAGAAAPVLAGLGAWAAGAPREHVVEMVAKKWAFVPETVRIRRGETLVLKLSAPEVPMGFNLPDFNVRTDVVPGGVATVSVTPDRAGSFTFLCDVFCGDGHEGMNGTLVVEA